MFHRILEKANRPQRAIACFALGALGSLAMAPYNIWGVLIPSLSFFYLLLDRTTSAKGAFAYGWLFAFGYFFTSLFWVKNALLVEGNPFSWIWPLAVAGLPSLLAFFIAVGSYGVKKFANLKTASGFLAFTAFITLVEWGRGWVLTGFPWNLFGYTWAGTLPMIQNVAIGNAYFLTWLTILWFALPGFLLLREPSKKKKVGLGVFAAVTFIACLGFGVWRLQNTNVGTVPDVNIKVVQPNIPQHEKWDRSLVGTHFMRMIDLSAPDPGIKGKTIIVWPETAVGHWLSQDPQTIEMIKATLKQYKDGAVLLTGLLRYEAQTDSYYNSLVMVDENGTISNIYNKYHLVPFGEYIPFQKWIPLKPVVEFTGFVLGEGVKTFEAMGIKYSPVICYEIIFPGKVVNADSPDVIINITNDAWYGFSPGPHQHLVQAQFRAVEEGMPVARSANTGISALIDPLGIIHAQGPLFQEYEKTLALPARSVVIKSNNTYKNLILLGLVLVTVGFAYTVKKRT